MKKSRRDKKFLPKRFNKDITEDQKSVLLNAMNLFDIRNTIVSLFRNGFIKSLDYQSTVKLEQEPKPEDSIGETTKLRKQRLNEIAENEKKINLELFKRYFKYSSPTDIYKNLNESINTERNKIQTESINNNVLTNLKKTLKIRLKIIQIKLKRIIKKLILLSIFFILMKKIKKEVV